MSDTLYRSMFDLHTNQCGILTGRDAVAVHNTPRCGLGTVPVLAEFPHILPHPPDVVLACPCCPAGIFLPCIKPLGLSYITFLVPDGVSSG